MLKTVLRTTTKEPQDLKAGDVIVEWSGSRPKLFPVSDAGSHSACPGATHVLLKSGIIWCYDGLTRVEVKN